MAVLIDDDLLFIHVPRTGGCSIREALYSTGRCTEYRMVHAGYDDLDTANRQRQCFAFRRDPWQRLVSMLLFQHPDAIDDPTERMWRFLNTPPASPALDHWRTQTSYLGDPVKIGRYERFVEDWREIAQQFNLPTELSRLNRSSDYDHRHFYDARNYDWVAEWHAADLGK